ncbi:MAG: hypothetical protein QXD13_00335 [Candidatus Pacearchaeota archaeon]
MEKMRANLIIEIMGKPKEHVAESLKLLVDKLGSEKGVKITEKTLHEPVEVKDSKELFTTFAEISAEFDSFEKYLGIIFAYMPSNVEIISPESLQIKNSELTDVGNKLLARLHDYDAIAKKIIAEKNFLLAKLYEVAPHLFKKNESAKPEKEEKNPKKK